MMLMSGVRLLSSLIGFQMGKLIVKGSVFGHKCRAIYLGIDGMCKRGTRNIGGVLYSWDGLHHTRLQCRYRLSSCDVKLGTIALDMGLSLESFTL